MSNKQQSWAAWLLDSYASSVSPVTSETPHDDDEDHNVGERTVSSPVSLSTARRMGSSPSALSSYGSYTRTGRGGAGNFYWHDVPSNQTPGPDLESQTQSSLSQRRKAAAALERIETGQAVSARRSSAQYMHVGRGGAGNFTQSNEIQSAKSPRSASAATPTYNAPVSAKSPTTTVGTTGRGGRGNIEAMNEAKSREQHERDEKEREDAEKRREVIVGQVDQLLRPPEGAVLGSSRKSSVLLEVV